MTGRAIPLKRRISRISSLFIMELLPLCLRGENRPLQEHSQHQQPPGKTGQWHACPHFFGRRSLDNQGITNPVVSIRARPSRSTRPSCHDPIDRIHGDFHGRMETRLISPAVWNGPRKSRPRRKRIAVSRAMRTNRPWIIARIILPGAGTKCRKSGKHQGTQVPGTFHPAPRGIARASTPGRRTAPINRSETRYGDFGHDGSCCLSDIVNPVLHPGSIAMKKPSKSGTFPAMIPFTCSNSPLN